MRSGIRGLCIGAALFAALPTGAEPLLKVHTDDNVLATLPLPEGQEACLSWAHSVTGGKVADCFENRAGHLVLTRSYLHDFAAGLGEVPGRGVLISAPEGGYWIEHMDEPMPDNALTLRIGSARVGHRLTTDDTMLPLSELAPGKRARLTLSAD